MSLVASLLPAPLYRTLVDSVTRRRSVRLGGSFSQRGRYDQSGLRAD